MYISRNSFRWFGLLGGLAISHLSTNNARAVGAVTPFTTIEAEAGALGAGATVVAFTPGSPVPSVPTPELEASGMAYVMLTNLYDSVSWTNPVPGANAMVIRSCLPDATGGGGITATLDLYVDGTFRQAVVLSSQQSWNYRNSTTTPDDPKGGGTPWHFYNEDHTFITGSALAAGSIIKLQRDSTNTAPYYKIDCIDLENVPPPLTQPSNSLSIISYGADPTDVTDSTVAIQNCIAVAQTQKKIVWIPQGTFIVSSNKSGGFTIVGVTVAGAGMWYSTLYRNIPLPQPTNSTWRSAISINTNTVLQDFAIDSDAVWRGFPGGSDYATGSVGTNWLIQRIWARHCSPNWLGGSYSTIRDCRVSDSWADGINLNDGNAPNIASQGIGLVCSNNFVRGCGDDGLTTYSDSGSSGLNYQMQNTRIVNNTSMATYWANGLRIAGGTNVVVQGNLIDSVAANNGIEVSVFGNTGHALDSALVSGNVILRAGGWNTTNRNGIDVGAPGSGSYFSNAVTRATISNNIVRLALRDALSIGPLNEAVTVVSNVFDQPALDGIWIESGVKGTGLFEYNTVTNLNAGETPFKNDSAAAFTTTVTNNSWQLPNTLSQGQPATASSYQTTNPPANGNDGDLTTRWSSASPMFPQWWQVDLGTNRDLTGVTIDWYDSSTRGYRYQIAVSTDNLNFTTVVDKSGNTAFGNTTDNFSALARYVKINVIGTTASGGYAGFYECLVYGAAIAVNPTNLMAVASGNTLTLSWPADHRGWHLQAQTNTPGSGLGTNWVTLPGSDQMIATNIIINHADNGSIFYRLVY